LLVHSTSVTQHEILINTRDTAIGDYLDKVARVLQVPWGDKMPGAALERWSEINIVDEIIISQDIARWELTKPLSVFKKNVPAFSFTGIRTMVERIVEGNNEMTEDEKKSLGRAAQMLVFEHVAEKCVLGIKFKKELEGSLVVSGGVACNAALRRMYFHPRPYADCSIHQTLEGSGLQGYKVAFPPVELCTVRAYIPSTNGRTTLR
jgi:N6-L-threonylcarbamoyladenine synthase